MRSVEGKNPTFFLLMLVIVEESPSLVIAISSFPTPKNMRLRTCVSVWSKFWSNVESSHILSRYPQPPQREKKTKNTPSDNAGRLGRENTDMVSTLSIKPLLCSYCQKTILITPAFTDEST